MSLPQVVPRLTALGLRVDLCSWYPWLHDTDHAGGNYFGMDSCTMFHIGGDVLCKMTWDFDKIEKRERARTLPRPKTDGTNRVSNVHGMEYMATFEQTQA